MKKASGDNGGSEKEEKKSQRQEALKQTFPDKSKDCSTSSGRVARPNVSTQNVSEAGNNHGHKPGRKEGVIYVHRPSASHLLSNTGPSNYEFTGLKVRGNTDNVPQPFLTHSALNATSTIKPPNDPVYNLLFSQNKTTVKTDNPTEKSSLASAPVIRPKPVIPVAVQSPGQTSNADNTNRAAGFRVRSGDETSRDPRQSFIVPPFTCDSLLFPSSPVPSPLFTDSTTVFPFSNTDYVIDQDTGYIDLPYVGSSAFTSVSNRLDNQSARTESIQNLMSSSTRHSAARLSSTSALNQQILQNANTHYSAFSNGLSIINCGAKKRVVTSSEVQRPSVSDKRTGAIQASSGLPEHLKVPKVTKNGVTLTRSVHGKGPVATATRKTPDSGVEDENPLKRPRSDSSGSKSSYPTKDPFSHLQPPPPGGIKRAGPYLLGKLYNKKCTYTVKFRY